MINCVAPKKNAPKKNELYWYTENGFVFHKRYHSAKIDRARYLSGNCFKTRKAVIEKIELFDRFGLDYMASMILR